MPSPEILLHTYRLEKLLKQTTSAEVHLATHLELKVPRALKVLRRETPGLNDWMYEDWKTRFSIEAQLGAQIDHPRVVRVEDFRRDGETLVLIMEYCAGGSLADKLAKAREAGKPIPVDECLHIAAEALILPAVMGCSEPLSVRSITELFAPCITPPASASAKSSPLASTTAGAVVG